MINGSESERNTISLLSRVAYNWPEHLWVFVASGIFYLMRRDENGQRAMTASGAVDGDYIVTTISIPCDGGDW